MWIFKEKWKKLLKNDYEMKKKKGRKPNVKQGGRASSSINPSTDFDIPSHGRRGGQIKKKKGGSMIKNEGGGIRKRKDVRKKKDQGSAGKRKRRVVDHGAICSTFLGRVWAKRGEVISLLTRGKKGKRGKRRDLEKKKNV